MSKENGKVCCNCRHNIRTNDMGNIRCKCEIHRRKNNEQIHRPRRSIEELKRFAPEHLTPLIVSLIEKQPTADVAEVVRCRDCIFYDPYELESCKGQGNCSQLLGLEFCVEDNFYCGYGARMDGETE